MIKFKSPKMNDFLVSTGRFRTKPNSIHTSVSAVPLAFTIGNKGNYYTNVGRSRGDEPMVYVYHAEKVRDKSSHDTIKKRGRLESVSNVVRKGGWTIRLFAFPERIVKKVKQEVRHFYVELDFSQRSR